MEKKFNVKTVIKTTTKVGDVSLEKNEEISKAFEGFDKIFEDFGTLNTIQQDDLTVTIKDGIISIKGKPTSIELEGKEIYKLEEENAENS